MKGQRPARRGGEGPLDDVVSWFQSWLGRRRESLGRGGVLPRAELSPSVHDSAFDALRRGVGAVSSDVFDRAFRAVVAADEPIARPGDGLRPLPAQEGAPPVDWAKPPRHALRREALYHWLERWYADTDLDTLGGVADVARRPWLRIRIGATQCHLNANTSRAGIADYLALARAEGPRLDWYVVTGRSGVINEVALGRQRARIRGFQLYTDSVFRHSGVIGGARDEPNRSSRTGLDGSSAA